MITTIPIANIGFPTEPPDTCQLEGLLYVPDPAIWAPPYHCMVGTRAGHFQDGGIDQLETPFRGKPGVIGLAERGFLCLAFQVRLIPNGMPPGPDGQTTTGLWPQQTNDMEIAIRYMRQGAEIETTHGFSVTGFVGGIGGSGSAHHAIWKAIDGTEFDDLLDAAICMSAATDYSDRENIGDPGGVSSHFIESCAVYADLPDTDLAGLLAKSPIALPGLATAKPIRQINGDHENMPITQLTKMQTAMVAAGNTDYVAQTLTGDGGGRHAFAEWPFIFESAIAWLEAVAADFDGDPGGGGPPPPEGIRERVTVAISGLSPGVTYNFVGSAINIASNLEGPPASFEFISDRADTGGTGKTAPVGVYALVDAVEGVIVGDISTRAWLGFAYVDGGVLPTTWAAINTPSRTSFDWSQTDAFLAALFDNNKQGGLAISMGIKCPSWIYSGGHAVQGFAENGPNSGTIPIPWDPNYLETVKRFIIELATRYDTHPNLSYVTVGGMGQLLDTLLVQQSADYLALNALAVTAGYPNLITAWVETSVGIMDVWSKGFRTTPCYVAINTPIPSADGGLIGIDEFVRVAIQKYRSRIGFMTLELDGSTAAGADLSLNTIIRDATRNPRAYRFRYPSSDPNCDPTQGGAYDAELGLQNAAEAGITIGVQMEEFYEADILTVTDNYPTHFASFQTDLTNNAV